MPANNSLITINPVITAGGYVTNDCMGGMLPFPSLFGSLRCGRLRNIYVRDSTNQKPRLFIYFFSRALVDPPLDKQQFVWGENFKSFIFATELTPANWFTFAGRAVGIMDMDRTILNSNDAGGVAVILTAAVGLSMATKDALSVDLAVQVDG